MARFCERPGCSQPAEAIYGMSSALLSVWLEPYDEVAVIVPDDQVGHVMSDVSSRRGRLLGTDKLGADRTVVRAHVPQTELVRYAVDLRSSTHGGGTFSRTFAHYEPMSEEHAKGISPREH